ncbi:hypothetical protein OB69_09430 [Roseivirga seohaensis subsp. aquiponti]|uniref:Uncharacterized protein n=1 Tax=Roseivirga seohaensis subsp. aquiponti TaxID=1566026 RepID=A0A0L8ALD8_9BACT|nr:hypothetical protein OB69_09430 [Roseivirga seohaensis subsp. aquiponti]
MGLWLRITIVNSLAEIDFIIIVVLKKWAFKLRENIDNHFQPQRGEGFFNFSNKLSLDKFSFHNLTSIMPIAVVIKKGLQNSGKT